MRLGLGIGNLRPLDEYEVLDNLFARAKIAGIDGTITESRGTARTSIFDGSLVPANTPVRGSMAIGNKLIPCFAAFPQTTNLNPWSEALENWSLGNDSNPPSTVAAAPLIVDPLGTNKTQLFTPGISGNTLGCTSGTANRAFIELDAGSGAYTMQIWVKSAGTVGQFGILGVKKSSDEEQARTAITVTSSWQRVVLTFVPTTSGVRFLISSQYPVYVAFSQCEFSDTRGPYIPTSGTAVTQNVDYLMFTPSITPDNTAGSFLVFSSTYSSNLPPGPDKGNVLFDADTGGNEGTTIYYYGDSNIWFNRASATSGNTIDGIVVSSGPGSIRSAELSWGATVNGYDNGNLVGSVPTPSRPFRSDASYFVGSNRVLTAPIRGAVAIVFVPGGLTDQERLAIETYRQKAMVFI